MARLFGSAQRLDAVLEAGQLVTGFGRWPLDVLAPATAPSLLESGRALELSLRPDSLQLASTADDAGVTVHEVRLAGNDDLVELDNGQGGRLYVRHVRPHGLQAGDPVRVQPAPGSVFAFPPRELSRLLCC